MGGNQPEVRVWLTEMGRERRGVCGDKEELLQELEETGSIQETDNILKHWICLKWGQKGPWIP